MAEKDIPVFPQNNDAVPFSEIERVRQLSLRFKTPCEVTRPWRVVRGQKPHILDKYQRLEDSAHRCDVFVLHAISATLPAELLLEIFNILFGITTPRDRFQLPLILQAVCRRWYNILRLSSHLWGTLTIPFSPGTNFRCLLNLYLERSRSAGLQVYLVSFISEWKERPAAGWCLPNCVVEWLEGNQLANRIRKLTVKSLSKPMDALAVHLLNSCQSAQQNVDIARWTESLVEAVTLRSDFIRYMTVPSPIISLDFQFGKRLKALCVPVENHIQAVALCTSLKDALALETLQVLCRSASGGGFQQASVILPSLCELEIQIHHHDRCYLDLFLGAFNAPRISRLTLSSGDFVNRQRWPTKGSGSWKFLERHHQVLVAVITTRIATSVSLDDWAFFECTDTRSPVSGHPIPFEAEVWRRDLSLAGGKGMIYTRGSLV